MSHEILWIKERFGAKVMDQWLEPLKLWVILIQDCVHMCVL